MHSNEFHSNNLYFNSYKNEISTVLSTIFSRFHVNFSNVNFQKKFQSKWPKMVWMSKFLIEIRQINWTLTVEYFLCTCSNLDASFFGLKKRSKCVSCWYSIYKFKIRTIRFTCQHAVSSIFRHTWQRRILIVDGIKSKYRRIHIWWNFLVQIGHFTVADAT